MNNIFPFSRGKNTIHDEKGQKTYTYVDGTIQLRSPDSKAMECLSYGLIFMRNKKTKKDEKNTRP